MQTDRPQDRIHRKEEKPPARRVQMTLPLDLIAVLEEMKQHCGRTLPDMIEASLKWAVWAYCHGRGPDKEMMADLTPDVPEEERRGYRKWNDKIRERQEIAELKKLYTLGDDEKPGKL